MEKPVADFINSPVTYKEGDVLCNGIKVAGIPAGAVIQNFFEDVEDVTAYQDKIGNWIADAINEKLEREK